VRDMVANTDTLIRAHGQGSDNLVISSDNYDRADQP